VALGGWLCSVFICQPALKENENYIKCFEFYIFSLTFVINTALLYSAANKAENDLHHWERRLAHNTAML